jgi:filamentous hemagglutinin
MGLPEAMSASQNTLLIKLVPKNASGADDISGYSPFFITSQQYDSLTGVFSAQIANYLGLPAEQGVRGAQFGFDVYAMQPLPGQAPVVFSSKVAPVQQGSYSASGGAQQILVPNRAEWTDPNANNIGTIKGAQ